MEAEVELAILRTISYFQVFDYPITKAEIKKFLSQKHCEPDFTRALRNLEAAKLIFSIDGYYSFRNDIWQVIRRINGNLLGEQKLKKARIIAKLLGMFPFVEAVCISGSLSKDFALPGSDLDFFIVTAPGRLWTCRNFMHLFRKLTFAVNAQKAFCMNYYIDVSKPEIFPKNLYTATELATLKVAYMHGGASAIFDNNKNWLMQHLPNTELQVPARKDKKWFLSKWFEHITDALGGDKIERYFYKSTMKRWARKWHGMNYDMEACMRSAGPHFNTPINYPIHLPDKIIDEYTGIYKKIESEYLSITRKKTRRIAPDELLTINHYN